MHTIDSDKGPCGVSASKLIARYTLISASMRVLYRPDVKPTRDTEQHSFIRWQHSTVNDVSWQHLQIVTNSFIT